jgi:hypothetical protein
VPKWTDYTIKADPADNDEVMVLDTAGKANKRLGLSTLSDWIIGKIANKVFENLQTQNKTILGALNELNSKTFLLGKSIGTANTKNLNNIYDGIYFYNGWGWDLKPPTNGTVPFINDTGIWIRMTLDVSTIDIVIAGKDAKIYTSKNKANSWTAK